MQGRKAASEGKVGEEEEAGKEEELEDVEEEYGFLSGKQRIDDVINHVGVLYPCYCTACLFQI